MAKRLGDIEGSMRRLAVLRIGILGGKSEEREI